MGSTVSVSLRVPSWQINPSLPSQQQFANVSTREESKRRLLSRDFSSLTAVSDSNPQIKDIIISVIGSRSTEPENEDEDSPALNGRVAGIELLLSVLTRFRKPKHLQLLHNCIIIVSLGIKFVVKYVAIA